MTGACLLRVHIQLLRLPRRLTTRSSDDEHILEPILVESLAGGLDSYLAFLVRYMLSFAIGPLDEDSGYVTLLEDIARSGLIVFSVDR